MRKTLLILIGIILLAGCSRHGTGPGEGGNYLELRPLTAKEQIIVNSNQEFGLNLLQRIGEDDPTGNLFISPLSVSMALGMTLNGAAGQTYTDMQQTLGLAGLTENEINRAYKSTMDLLMSIDPDVITQIANSIWVRQDYPVEPAFIDTNEYYFDAMAAERDFSDGGTLDEINGWIADNTNDLITEMLDYIDPSAIMYLINAIYFKAIWEIEFNKDDTGPATFYSDNGSQTIDMMSMTADLQYFEDDQAQVIDMHYGRGNFTMTVFLPAADVDLNTFLDSLNDDRLYYYLANLTEKNGTIYLPRLKTRYNLLMNDVLISLGMESAFSPIADFTRINANGGIYISRVLHEAFVQIDEEGTEAAAATIVEMKELSGGPEVDFVMNVNQPYLFLIRERETDAILFMGKIHEPVWED